MNGLLIRRPVRTIAVIGGLALLALTACASDPQSLASKPGVKPEPDCPALQTYLAKDRAGAVPADGCVNRANLAAMVADPADLGVGKPLAGTDGARQAVIVDAYRRNQDKASSSASSPAAAPPAGSMLHAGGP